MKKNAFLQSTIIITVAALISKFLGAIFRIPLQNIAGDEVLGIFSMVYPVYMVALILSVAGIPLAISKLIAEADSKETVQEIHTTAKILALFFGTFSFFFIFSFSDLIVSLLGGESTRPALLIVSVTLLIAPYMAVYRGFFQGYEDMRPTAVSQVIEQFVRVILVLAAAYYLVVQGYSNAAIAGGAMIGSSIGALASLIYLVWTYRRSAITPLPSTSYSIQSFKTWSRTILKVSIPIAVGAITLALMNVVDTLTIPLSLRMSDVDSDIPYLYGIYGRGLALVQIATVFASSLVLPLMPLISKKLKAGEEKGVQHVIQRSFTLTHLLSWPAGIGILVLALPLNLSLFTNLEGSVILATLGFSSVYTALAVLGTGILQTLNRSGIAALIVVGAVFTKGVMNVLFIEGFGLIGGAFATVLVFGMLHLLNRLWIRKETNASAFSLDSLKGIIASFIMGAVLFIPVLFVSFEEWTRWEAGLYSLFAVIIGALIYGGLLYWWKVQEVTQLLDPYLKRFIR
ncbi:polysaccharide biosynthesis protein [Halobacillus yeomjeoni]|uniref:Polysaccharide biosynthesis protein n=1 Tax=Halobacillus yeomjeoni TaxID=311194 RepID=A0A931MVS2_9BACI|nr:polysaccharide biosynthesis protein [Halobacillus yeomjeoni]MBH0230716.1 polysaccharide biosynthesis protein [Halobacillus yeomjeoni]